MRRGEHLFSCMREFINNIARALIFFWEGWGGGVLNNPHSVVVTPLSGPMNCVHLEFEFTENLILVNNL